MYQKFTKVCNAFLSFPEQTVSLRVYKFYSPTLSYTTGDFRAVVPANPTKADVANAAREYLRGQGIEYHGKLEITECVKDGKKYYRHYYSVKNTVKEIYINQDGEYYLDQEMPCESNNVVVLEGNDVILKQRAMLGITENMSLQNDPVLRIYADNLPMDRC